MFTDTASSKVTAAHLSKTAPLYVRQSTLKQVLNNTESAIRQYDLRGRAVALGWAGAQITVIDIDQGHSGASPPTGKGSSSWSPSCPWAGPGSCSDWNAPGWPATPPCSDIGTRRFVPRTDLCRVGTRSSCRVVMGGCRVGISQRLSRKARSASGAR